MKASKTESYDFFVYLNKLVNKCHSHILPWFTLRFEPGTGSRYPHVDEMLRQSTLRDNRAL